MTSSKFLSFGRLMLLPFLFVAYAAANDSTNGTNIFAPASGQARSVAHLSAFVLAITGIIFVVVFTLLVYSIIKFRGRAGDAGREPAQVYGSTQIELAWTVIPILIVVAMRVPAPAAETPAAATPAKLPKTGSELPLIGLFGLACISASLGLKLIRRA